MRYIIFKLKPDSYDKIMFHINIDSNIESSCLHRASIVSKTLFIIPTDAHNYKIIGMLKQLKFRELLRHVSVHAGTIIRELFCAWLKLQL
jgi:hypothetical protein